MENISLRLIIINLRVTLVDAKIKDKELVGKSNSVSKSKSYKKF